MANRTIAVSVALVVVFGVFFKDFYKPAPGETLTEKVASTPFSLSFFKPNFIIPDLASAGIEAEVWSVFQNYLQAAQAHDVDALRNLSHQLSPTCADAVKVAECNQLMDSVYLIAENWEQEEFKNVAYDDRQIVLSTNSQVGIDNTPTKTAIFFTRTNTGEPKVLSIKLCFGVESDLDKCVNTDPSTRDLDNNGWWDEVETFFSR